MWNKGSSGEKHSPCSSTLGVLFGQFRSFQRKSRKRVFRPFAAPLMSIRRRQPPCPWPPSGRLRTAEKSTFGKKHALLWCEALSLQIHPWRVFWQFAAFNANLGRLEAQNCQKENFWRITRAFIILVLLGCSLVWRMLRSTLLEDFALGGPKGCFAISNAKK